MVIVGILILFGSVFLNSKEFQLTKLTGFISNIKNTTLETIHRVQAKDQSRYLDQIFLNTRLWNLK